MKKLIGITTSPNSSKQINSINNSYIKAFNTETTTPILIPCLFENQNETVSEKEKASLKENIDKITKSLDALILSGGSDLSPVIENTRITDSEAFNYNRDFFEKELVTAFVASNKPILGICRGFQLLGKMLNLNYWQQDLSDTEEVHDGLKVDITNRKEPIHYLHAFGKLKEFLKAEGITTNSWHHQGFTLRPEGERVKNKDIEAYIGEKKQYWPSKIVSDKEMVIELKQNTTKEKPLNYYPNIEILLATNHVIEGFQHKTLPILGFQPHPEEYTNSLLIKYFLEKFLT